jgi:hypothetical protein
MSMTPPSIAMGDLPLVSFGEIDTASPPPDVAQDGAKVVIVGDADDDEDSDAPLLPHDTLIAILGFDPDFEEDSNANEGTAV